MWVAVGVCVAVGSFTGWALHTWSHWLLLLLKVSGIFPTRCPEAIINQCSHLHYKVPLGSSWGGGWCHCWEQSHPHPPAGPVSGAARRESPPWGQEGDPGAEELREPQGLTPCGFRAAAPLKEQLMSPTKYVAQMWLGIKPSLAGLGLFCSRSSTNAHCYLTMLSMVLVSYSKIVNAVVLRKRLW